MHPNVFDYIGAKIKVKVTGTKIEEENSRSRPPSLSVNELLSEEWSSFPPPPLRFYISSFNVSLHSETKHFLPFKKIKSQTSITPRTK